MHFSGVPCSNNYGSLIVCNHLGLAFGFTLCFVGFIVIWNKPVAQEATMAMVNLRPAGGAVGGRAVYECILSKF